MSHFVAVGYITTAPYWQYKLAESHPPEVGQVIYGSSRLGLVERNLPLLRQVANTDSVIYYSYTTDSIRTMYRGEKRYAVSAVMQRRRKLSNHLGNVLAVITDRRIQSCNIAGIMHYSAQVVSVSDYYPFGMGIKEREWSDSTFSYRFGFNGMEKDNEVKGSGKSYDYGFRIYNPRIGKFLSVDPLFQSYPWYTPYQFAGNKPIVAIDMDGLEENINTEELAEAPPEPKIKVGDEAQILDIVKSIQTDLIKAWDGTGMPDAKKVKESGGAIVKDASGNISVHRYRVSKRAGAIRLNWSHKKIPKGSQLIGDFHTHPYSKIDIGKSGYNDFSGTGMAFSISDFMSTNRKTSKKGFVAMVYAGEGKAFAMEITDKKLYNKFKDQYSGSIRGIFDEIDNRVYSKIQENKDLKYEEVYFETMIEVLNEQNEDLGFIIYEITGIALKPSDIKVEKKYEYIEPEEPAEDESDTEQEEDTKGGQD